MIRVLLRLRFSLMARSFGKRVSRRSAIAASYALSGVLGVLVGGLVATSRAGGVSVAVGLARGLPAVLLLGWIIGPLMTGGLDSTVDPQRLAVYPLTRRQITLGLFIVSCVGGGGFFSALALTGLLVASTPPGPLAVVSVVAAVSVLGICVTGARAAAIGISMASRRVRDALIFAAPVVFMAVSILPALLDFGETRGEAPDLNRLGDAGRRFASFLPTGAAGEAMAAAAQGRNSAAVGYLAGSLLCLGLLVWLLSKALDRSLTRAPAPVTSRRSGSVSATAALFPRALRWLPRSRWGAVAVKDLRLAFRDPRQRTAVLGSVIGAIPFAVIGLTGEGGGHTGILRLAAVSFFVGANATNLYGFDGPSHWMNVAAGDDARSDLFGKAMTRVILSAAVVPVALIGYASASGAWDLVLPAAALAVAGMGLGLGPAVWVSVLHPAPIPAGQRNVFATTNTGQGMSAFGPIMAITIVGALLLLGVGYLMVGPAFGKLGPVIGSAVAVALGAGVLVIGMRAAIARSRNNQPELLAALSKPV